MKIGIVRHPSIGGSGLVATQLGLGLARKGHELHFISRAMPFKLLGCEKNSYFHPVEPINYPLFDDNLYTFALTAKIIEIAEQYQLDIVHAHYSILHSLCMHLLAFDDEKIILHISNFREPKNTFGVIKFKIPILN